MIAVEDTVLILLAAGRSQRWGAGDSKLDAPFLGRPLGLHVAVALEDMPFRQRIAVTGRATIDYAAHGYRVVPNPDPRTGMGSSVVLGVEQAKAQGAAAVLIALADMPRITASHLYRMFEATTGADSVVASSDSHDAKPPAIFGCDRFDLLLALHGDAGARDLLAGGRHVVTAPAELIDIDTPEDLERLRALVHSPEGTARTAGEVGN